MGDLFRLKGYDDRLTPSTSDLGAATNLEGNRRRVAAQTKQRVANQAIRDVYADTTNYGADHARVVTTARFSVLAREAGRTLGDDLTGGPQLRACLEKSAAEEWITMLDIWRAKELVAAPDISTPGVKRPSSSTRQCAGTERGGSLERNSAQNIADGACL